LQTQRGTTTRRTGIDKSIGVDPAKERRASPGLSSKRRLGRVRTARTFDGSTPADTSIFLLEGGKRVLPSFSESSVKKAAARLEKLGVKVVTGAMVEHIDEHGVSVGGKRIESGTVLWTAGVSPSPLVKMLGVATDRALPGVAQVAIQQASPYALPSEFQSISVAQDCETKNRQLSLGAACTTATRDATYDVD
jgi:glycine/D-amino acid oxidase-like deaminating enzyme